MDYSTIEIHLASPYDLSKENKEVVESVQSFLEDKFMTRNIGSKGFRRNRINGGVEDVAETERG